MGSGKDNVVIQSVQIMRILEALEADGYAKVTKKGAQTYYGLTAEGVLYLIQELVKTEHYLPIAEILFINYYLTTYRPQLQRLAKSIANADEQAKLLALLKPGLMLERQLGILDQIIQRLEGRQADYDKIRKFLENPANAELSLDERIKKLPLGPSIPQTYKKSLREVLEDLPENLRAQEINQGFQQRREYYLEPYGKVLTGERQLLVSLLEGMRDGVAKPAPATT